MTESDLHRGMKEIVCRELEGEGYRVLEEPLLPPTRRMSWQGYRPDLLGIGRRGVGEEIVLVECETRPSTKKLISKNWSSVSFQPFLFREGTLRLILAVPQGTLHNLDMSLRGRWEIWVLGAIRTICKVPMLRPQHDRENGGLVIEEGYGTTVGGKWRPS